MKSYDYIILGAGPSGLSVAHGLVASGVNIKDILVLEKNNVAGGLCCSEQVDGAPLDTGGGHFLDVKHERVLNFLFEFMPRKEWKEYTRISKIKLHGQLVDHPLEANLWQLPTEVQTDYLESIAAAGCNSGQDMPKAFSEWVTWKLGEKISEEYMIPYNEKMWSIPLSELGTYWLYKLPNVSFRQTLLSCLTRKPEGSLPAHGTFLYPKEFGYGEVWRRMGEALSDSLFLNTPVESIDPEQLVVNSTWKARSNIINTIPWTHWLSFAQVPSEVRSAIAKLEKVSIDVRYEPETVNSNAHWIYDPDPKVAHHRLVLRSNFMDSAKGHWTETNSVRSMGGKGQDEVCFHNTFAYPINTVEKPQAVELIKVWAESIGVLPLGRWGKWEHMNSDIAVLEALQMADQIMESLVSR